MTDVKVPEDGFKEIGDGEAIDPLTSAIQVTLAKDEPSKATEGQKSKTNASMNDKLKSVFGSDVIFEDQQPKNVQVHRPKSRPPTEQSPTKLDSMVESPDSKSNLLTPSSQKSTSKFMESPFKNPREEAAILSLQTKPAEEEEEDVPLAERKATKMRYKDLVANSDQFEEERIEATFLDNNTSISGALKLGQFMVS